MKKSTGTDAFKTFHEEIVRVATRNNDTRVGHFDDHSGGILLNGYKCEYISDDDDLRIFFLAPGELAGTDEPDLLFTWSDGSWKRVRLAMEKASSPAEIATLCFNWLRKMAAQQPAVKVSESFVVPQNMQTHSKA